MIMMMMIQPYVITISGLHSSNNKKPVYILVNKASKINLNYLCGKDSYITVPFKMTRSSSPRGLVGRVHDVSFSNSTLVKRRRTIFPNGGLNCHRHSFSWGYLSGQKGLKIVP